MSSFAQTPRQASSSPVPQHYGLPIDHTRWMARVVELLAIAGAVAFAYLHAAP